MYAGGDQQHRKYPPVPDTHHTVYGGNLNQHRDSGGYNGSMEGRGGPRWICDKASISSLPPPPQGDFVGGSQDYRWSDGRGMGEQKGSWGAIGPSSARGFEAASSIISDRGSNTWQGGQNMAINSRSNIDGGWRRTDGGGHPRVRRDGQPREHGDPQEYRHLGPEVPPCTKASTMHNPVDPEELARIQAKKDAYRRDLETQVIEAASARSEKRRGWSGVVRNYSHLETTHTIFNLTNVSNHSCISNLFPIWTFLNTKVRVVAVTRVFTMGDIVMFVLPRG